MHYMQTLLLSVPSARLADEFSKMVLSGSAVACMELMNRYDVDMPIPLFDVLKRTFGLPFVRKGLERCDAGVALGKSISTSFLFAVLLWHEMKEEVAKSTGKTPGQIYEEAAKRSGRQLSLGRLAVALRQRHGHYLETSAEISSRGAAAPR